MDHPPRAERNLAEAEVQAVAGEPTVVVGKEDLLATLRRLLVYCREYGDLLEGIADTPDWRERATALFLAHAERMQAGDGSLEQVGLVMSLIQFLLRRSGQARFQFRVPSRVGYFPEEENPELTSLSHHLREWSDPVRLMVADIQALEAAVAPEARERLRLVLAAITSFCKGVVRQDWDDVALLVSHLNLVTTTRDRHELVEQIARIAREIYDSLNRFSEEISYQALTTTTEEIPDAVVKLHSVIQRLGEAADANLDGLERLTEEVRDNARCIAEGQQAIATCDAELQRLAAEHPGLRPQWESIRQTLRGEVQTKLETLADRMRAEGEAMLTLMSHQSFQDLTGQTLRRVIDFIESLQFQLVEVLKRHMELTSDAKAALAGGAVPPRPPPQSQEQVDQLLTDLGF